MKRHNISTISRTNLAEEDAKTIIKVDKQQWMLLKGELEYTSAELRHLEVHVAVLNKCNSSLEEENDEQKSYISTFRLRKAEPVGKGTQFIFRSTRTSRKSRGYPIEFPRMLLRIIQ